MTDHSTIARRDLFGLAAATAALGATSAAADNALTATAPRTRPIQDTPGSPVVTKVVDTTSGRVQGLVNTGVHTFKGVRYGAPPVGALRWMPPQKPEKVSYILDCSDFGAPAIQMASGATAAHATDFGLQMNRAFTTPSDIKIQNEDCLFLNVWSNGTDTQKRPVMVWIHGGGFAYGSGGQPIYDMEALAREYDVCCVSMNHRLNVFGYLNLADAFGAPYASSGTVGMQDLVLALEWVRDNIANFGGDPGNVTIMGQSGGGAKVSILLAMESAKGLFHKASIQSGPGLTVGKKDQAAKNAQALLDELGVKDVKGLQALPPQAILAATEKAAAKINGPRMPGMRGGGAGFSFGPIVDGVAITRDPFTPDAPAVSANVPIMIGYTKDEMALFMAAEPWFGTMTEDQLKQFIGFSGPKGPAVLDAWRKLRPDYSPTYLFVATISSMFAMGGSITLAERKYAQHGAPIYMWEMVWETPVANGIFKAPHCMEIPFMLNSWRRVPQFVGPAKEAEHMAKQIAGAWVAFARTGVPNGPATPAWPAYTPDTRATMLFDHTSKVVNDPFSDVRKVLES
jgi:para-nitrobenzyl esterase